ncbi:MAG: N-acetylmuramoyl-L-alanine amidase [Anaerolineales bacterium]|nr:N-acetylmuramoyl-L-alanine amidase [Anaerolineales bacterium]
MDTTSSPTQPPQPVRKTVRKAYRPFYAIQTTLFVALLLATLFTAWTPAGLFSGSLSEKLAMMLTAQPAGIVPIDATAHPRLPIGIVAGHWGNGDDSGAVCRDSSGQVTLTEVDVNLKIALLVQDKLTRQGFTVDVLQEFDPRLNGYQAMTLVSIHNDSCEYVDDQATGFKVAAAMTTRDPNRATRLTDCMRDRYQSVTGLKFHAGSITADMREYHAFSEIDPYTIAGIIETGFLNLDRKILTEETERVAEGVTQGILCFVFNENIEPTPTPMLVP